MPVTARCNPFICEQHRREKNLCVQLIMRAMSNCGYITSSRETHQWNVNTPVNAVAIYDQVGEENNGQIASVKRRDWHWRRWKELREGGKPTAIFWHRQRVWLVKAAVDRCWLLHPFFTDAQVFDGLESKQSTDSPFKMEIELSKMALEWD